MRLASIEDRYLFACNKLTGTLKSSACNLQSFLLISYQGKVPPQILSNLGKTLFNVPPQILSNLGKTLLDSSP